MRFTEFGNINKAQPLDMSARSLYRKRLFLAATLHMLSWAVVPVSSVLAQSTQVLAGSEYDRCIKEELALKKKEKEACSGLSYILNPSGCFTTQKALKEYTSGGKCRKIGVAEKVDFNAPAGVPAKNAAPAAAGKAASELPQQETNREQPRDEIARLKEEISRLRAENEQLRQRCRE